MISLSFQKIKTEFKVGPMYFNFPCAGNYITNCICYLNIRSGHEIETVIRGFSSVPLRNV